MNVNLAEGTGHAARAAEERQLLKFLDARYHARVPPRGATHEREWNRRSGVVRDQADGDTLHGEIQVRRHDLRVFGYPQHSYTLGAIFPTRLGWIKAEFYSLSAADMLARLPELEAEIVNLQMHLLAEEPQ